MIFSGSAITVERLEGQIAHLVFDLQGESVNKLGTATSAELSSAMDAIESQSDIAGLLISSRKSVFIVGADVTEFGGLFEAGADTISAMLKRNIATFNRIEDLPFPSVVAINGFAMGGGLEICLACDFRIMSSLAKIGLPETKLGLIPGWGGTVRLPRIAGVDVAVEWIASGAEQAADVALKSHVVDGVVEPDKLQAAALTTLKRAIAGELPYQARRKQKTSPLPIVDMESLLAFESAKMFVKAQAGRHYPAPVAAIKAMQDASKLGRDEALEIESKTFTELAGNPVARNLVGLFLSDQYLVKKAKDIAKVGSSPVTASAVLGAGIMGGGIAYQSASRGIPVKMKDIAQAGLDLGLKEASKLLAKRVERGKLTTGQMAEVLSRIGATLSYQEVATADIVVEAVVEDEKIKKSVLQELESKLGDDTVICSNTSTISIDALAENLRRPQNFCGMHFFNPVHAMPLVEVIRGAQTSDQTIATTVSYALALGKKPVVVNNCPGFLVNRVLFPYFAGFSMLLRDGADFQQVDRVMERWGWPMGPGYLLDVVGLDTAVHAESVMARGFPDRMNKSFKAATDILFEAGRLGQKNQQGFYDYEQDKKGKPVKKPSPASVELLQSHVDQSRDFSDEEIISRMMFPMATELARCLEEGIVASAVEADMALIYGVGFPPFRGGLFRWLDEMGLKAFVDQAKSFEHLGPLYVPPEGMLKKASEQSTYYFA